MTAIEAHDALTCMRCNQRTRCTEMWINAGRTCVRLCIHCLDKANAAWWAGQPKPGGVP